jgi:hypothetical protein
MSDKLRRESLFFPKKDTYVPATTLRRGTVFIKDRVPDKLELTSLPLSLQQNYNKSVGYYQQLFKYVSEIEKKVGGIVEKKESEFLNAYKTNVKNIEKQLQEIKTKATNNEAKTETDAKIMDLTNALEWFQAEFVKIGSLIAKQKTENTMLKEKLENSTQQCKFLDEYSKKNKKKLKAYKVLFTKVKSCWNESKSFLPDICEKVKAEMENILHSFNEGYAQDKALPSVKTPRTRNKRISSDNKESKNTRFVSMLSDYKATPISEKKKEELLKEFAEIATKKSNQIIISLEEKIKLLKKEISSLKKLLNDERNNKGEFEKLFIDCVKSVKKDAPNNEINTSNEKRKVIDLLVSNEEFIAALYGVLFGEKEEYSTFSSGGMPKLKMYTPASMRSDAKYKVHRGQLQLSNINKSFQQ